MPVCLCRGFDLWKIPPSVQTFFLFWFMVIIISDFIWIISIGSVLLTNKGQGFICRESELIRWSLNCSECWGQRSLLFYLSYLQSLTSRMSSLSNINCISDLVWESVRNTILSYLFLCYANDDVFVLLKVELSLTVSFVMFHY